MAYSTAWDEAQPLGSVAASDIDQLFRDAKKDMRERVAGTFGLNLAEWSADPIVPKTLTLSGALTAGSLVGPVTGNLTGTVLTPSQPNITSLGTLTSLSVSGRVIFGQGFSPPSVIENIFGSSSVTSSHGTEYSSGNFYSAFNVYQTGINGSGTDSWTQSLGALGSSLWHETNVGVELYVAPAGQAVGNFSTFWGAPKAIITSIGFIGNLTGTILTAAQGNITSLGILTGLTVSGALVLDPALIGNGFLQAKVAGVNKWALGYGVNTPLAFDLYNYGVPGSAISVSFATNQVTLAAGMIGTIITAAQPNITSLGTLTGLGVITGATEGIHIGNTVSAASNLFLENTQGGTNRNWLATTNYDLGGEFALRSSNATGGNPYSAGTSVFRLTNGGQLTLAGALVANVTGNLTGTVLTAAQANITSLGTLTGLSAAGATALNVVLNTTSGAATDNLGILFQRGGVTKWRLAQNVDGSNVDRFSLYSDAFGNVFYANQTTGQVNFNGSVIGVSISATTFSGALTGNVTGNLTGTVLTAAQANITSLGTLTALSLSGDLTMTAANSRLIPGATNFSHRNNANTVDNLLIADNGDTTVRGLLLVSSGNVRGMTVSGLGNGAGAQITLAKVSTVGPPVANAAQQAWLRFIGSDGTTYQVPAFT